jgi:hypothetical protein
MSEEQTYELEELKAMNRLNLRRICKGRGLSSEDCARLDVNSLAEWVVENQEGSSKPAKRSKKAAAKKAAAKKQEEVQEEVQEEAEEAPKTSGRSRLAAKRGKASAKPKPKEDVVDEETGEVELDLNALAELLGTMSERIQAIEEKIDELGAVYTANSTGLVNDVSEVAAENYKTAGLLLHLATWLRAEEILTDDNAPEGMDFDDKMEALDKDTRGNEEGDE